MKVIEHEAINFEFSLQNFLRMKQEKLLKFLFDVIKREKRRKKCEKRCNYMKKEEIKGKYNFLLFCYKKKFNEIFL